MTKEQVYEAQMTQLGIWQEIFKPQVHTLCIMERELQRFLKAWKAAGSDPEDERYAAIVALRRDILSQKNALGLTPYALKRLGIKGQAPKGEAGLTVLEQLRGKKQA